MAAKYDIKVAKNTTLRRAFVFKNPDKTPKDLTGYEFTVFVSPAGESEFQVTSAGTDPRLIYDLANGQFTLFISDVVLSSYAWKNAPYWVRRTEPNGDISRKIKGSIIIENPYG